MTTTPTSGAADLPEALRIAAAANVAREAINELRRLHALTAQDPSQPGGFDAGDMASAAAQGYRDGWTAAQAGAVPLTHAQNRDEIIAMALVAGMFANIGHTEASGEHFPAVAALKTSVPVQWLERFAQLVAAKAAAESVLEDADRLDWLAKSDWYVGPGDFYCGEGGGLYDCDDKNTGAAELRAALDAARAAQKEGSTT